MTTTSNATQDYLVDLTFDAVALHEAGHVVIAEILGIRQEGATLKPEQFEQVDEEPGFVRAGQATIPNPFEDWRRGDGPRKRLKEDWATAIYAGEAAEVVFIGFTISAFPDNNVSRDHEDADDALHYCKIEYKEHQVLVYKHRHVEGLEKTKKKLQKRAKKLCLVYHKTIIEIAQLLYKNGSVTREQVISAVSKNFVTKELARDTYALNRVAKMWEHYPFLREVDIPENWAAVSGGLEDISKRDMEIG